MDLDFDISDDFIILDGLEDIEIKPSRNTSDGSYAIDWDSQSMATGNPEGTRIFCRNCLFRLVSQRDNALVKQVFQRGVALASLDFAMVDAVAEIYPHDGVLPPVHLEDILFRVKNGLSYLIVAIDDSHMTERLRVAVRHNR